jgi:formylglycine-generating enzyme required for sulfatase activity
MGSPPDEPERYENEGPVHEVRFAEGFWLAETACAQDLWTEVMGENPSRFKDSGDSLRRPVERVSWNDVQTFLKTINERVRGLDLVLPSEAQWEYACRAGATTPFSFGGNIDPGAVNYDGGFPYAGATKGLDRGKTVPVCSLPPNPWGLYEMHGNVWEWCADVYRSRYEDALGDGAAWLDRADESSAKRVLRGGSWSNPARDGRSACRDQFDPVDWFSNIGFRCARVQG